MITYAKVFDRLGWFNETIKSWFYWSNLFILFLSFYILCNDSIHLHTVGFMKTVSTEYTLLANALYPSHSKQVAEGTVFMKHAVCKSTFYILKTFFLSTHLFFPLCKYIRLEVEPKRKNKIFSR